MILIAKPTLESNMKYFLMKHTKEVLALKNEIIAKLIHMNRHPLLKLFSLIGDILTFALSISTFGTSLVGQSIKWTIGLSKSIINAIVNPNNKNKTYHLLHLTKNISPLFATFTNTIDPIKKLEQLKKLLNPLNKLKLVDNNTIKNLLKWYKTLEKGYINVGKLFSLYDITKDPKKLGKYALSEGSKIFNHFTQYAKSNWKAQLLLEKNKEKKIQFTMHLMGRARKKLDALLNKTFNDIDRNNRRTNRLNNKIDNNYIRLLENIEKQAWKDEQQQQRKINRLINAIEWQATKDHKEAMKELREQDNYTKDSYNKTINKLQTLGQVEQQTYQQNKKLKQELTKDIQRQILVNRNKHINYKQQHNSISNSKSFINDSNKRIEQWLFKMNKGTTTDYVNWCCDMIIKEYEKQNYHYENIEQQFNKLQAKEQDYNENILRKKDEVQSEADKKLIGEHNTKSSLITRIQIAPHELWKNGNMKTCITTIYYVARARMLPFSYYNVPLAKVLNLIHATSIGKEWNNKWYDYHYTNNAYISYNWEAIKKRTLGDDLYKSTKYIKYGRKRINKQIIKEKAYIRKRYKGRKLTTNRVKRIKK